jgi:hypothetical protein
MRLAIWSSTPKLSHRGHQKRQQRTTHGRPCGSSTSAAGDRHACDKLYGFQPKSAPPQHGA